MKKFLILSLLTLLLTSCSSKTSNKNPLEGNLNQPIQTQTDAPTAQTF